MERFIVTAEPVVTPSVSLHSASHIRPTWLDRSLLQCPLTCKMQSSTFGNVAASFFQFGAHMPVLHGVGDKMYILNSIIHMQLYLSEVGGGGHVPSAPPGSVPVHRRQHVWLSGVHCMAHCSSMMPQAVCCTSSSSSPSLLFLLIDWLNNVTGACLHPLHRSL